MDIREFLLCNDITLWQWCATIAAAFLIGLSRTGLRGLATPVIPFLAIVYGGKESTGIILPLLITGDVLALYYYRYYTHWASLLKLLPWTYAGMLMGSIVGRSINDKQFQIFIASVSLLCLAIMIYIEKSEKRLEIEQRSHICIVMGILTGFSTMIGNAAGPVFSIYLLAMGFEKNDYLGMSAWFFFIVNMTKIPLQALIWNNMNTKTLVIAVLMIPIICLGALLGANLIQKTSETQFRTLIRIATAITAFNLII